MSNRNISAVSLKLMHMSLRLNIILIILVLTLTFGCLQNGTSGTQRGALGLRTRDDCAAYSSDRVADRMNCYHLAAMTLAYLENWEQAERTCQYDIALAYAANPSIPTDQRRMAEVEANECFVDVGRISGQTRPCGLIASYDPDPPVRSVSNAIEPTKTRCYQEAIRTSQLRTDMTSAIDPTRSTRTDPRCTPLLILLPLLALVVFRYK